MATGQECLDYARHCVRLAGFAKNDLELRNHLLQLARDWMAAAKHVEKVKSPKVQ